MASLSSDVGTLLQAGTTLYGLFLAYYAFNHARIRAGFQENRETLADKVSEIEWSNFLRFVAGARQLLSRYFVVSIALVGFSAGYLLVAIGVWLHLLATPSSIAELPVVGTLFLMTTIPTLFLIAGAAEACEACRLPPTWVEPFRSFIREKWPGEDQKLKEFWSLWSRWHLFGLKV